MTEDRMMEIVDRAYFGPWSGVASFVWFATLGLWLGFAAQAVCIPLRIIHDMRKVDP